MISFQISEMRCGHCASAIGAAIGSVDKGARVEVSLRDRRVRVSSRATQAELVGAIATAGHTAKAVEAGLPRAQKPAGGCCCGRAESAVDLRPTGSPPRGPCCG
ncbi:heavy-metal-associated domain-containing protein [Variovorax sp. EBFNA2]|uniref:heavy-metal-associated domain-containing protein n=1 Tax=Variovorax sp. EBFNA2 TaxID=3342097 RepID=UPI0029C0E52B|nr:heavy-metal-associated domain-containing protein [Variovorax boronicumulans]WPG40960.1 heavy-metal-associated domain-containing protein [Variovorax boronicumulans]